MKFAQNPTVRRKSAGLGIRGKLFSEISDTFVKAALAGNIPRINPKDLFTTYNEDEGLGMTKKKGLNYNHNSDIYTIFIIQKVLIELYYLHFIIMQKHFCQRKL